MVSIATKTGASVHVVSFPLFRRASFFLLPGECAIDPFPLPLLAATVRVSIPCMNQCPVSCANWALDYWPQRKLYGPGSEPSCSAVLAYLRRALKSACISVSMETVTVESSLFILLDSM